MSRRERKTDHGITDHGILLEAIKAVKVEKRSVKSTASEYNINRTSLGRYITKFDAEVKDITAVDDSNLLKIVKRISSFSTPCLVS